MLAMAGGWWNSCVPIKLEVFNLRKVREQHSHHISGDGGAGLGPASYVVQAQDAHPALVIAQHFCPGRAELDTVITQIRAGHDRLPDKLLDKGFIEPYAFHFYKTSEL